VQIGEFFLYDRLRIAVCEDPPVIAWDVDDLEVAHAVPTDGKIAVIRLSWVAQQNDSPSNV
jgi:hypothetical protein